MNTSDPFGTGVVDTASESSSERTFEATYPPDKLAVITGVCCLASAVCFAFGGRRGNIAGYALGAWIVMFSAILFRIVDGKRRTRSDYLGRPIWNYVVMGSIGTGLVLAFLHAWFIAQKTTYKS